METMPGVLVVGIRGCVVMVDIATGQEYWRQQLPYSGFPIGGALVTVLWHKGLLFAASAGHLFRLDPRTGQVLWRNELRGLGFSHIHMALEGANTLDALPGQAAQEEQQRHQHAH